MRARKAISILTDILRHHLDPDEERDYETVKLKPKPIPQSADGAGSNELMAITARNELRARTAANRRF